MNNIDFIKMSAAGNDFIIIDNRKNHHQFNTIQIAKIANRHNIGCDQLILLKPSNKADIFMDIYNIDGSSSDSCGNAARCVAYLIMEEKNCSTATLQTNAAILECQKEGDLIAVNMGKPKFNWQEIPFAKQLNTDSFTIDDPSLSNYKFSAVNMGNPHVITFINQEISNEDFFLMGPLIENHQLFPQKTNVEFVRIIAQNHLAVRVWERGVGETLACGSGACAVAVAAIKKRLVDNQQIKISFKGGDLLINWQDDNSVIMSGGYQKIFFATIDENFLL